MAKVVSSIFEKHDFENERLIKSLNVVFVLSALVHVGFLILFIKTGVVEMKVFNYFSPIIYILCLFLNMKGKLTLAVFIGLSEASIHGFISTYLLGWGSGFYYYIILGYLLVFFFSGLRFLVKAAIALGLTIAFVWLYLHCHLQITTYQLSSEVLLYLHIINLVLSVLVISVFALLYTSFLRKMETDLVASIKHMGETQKSLYDQIEENKIIQAELEKGNTLLDAIMENLPDYVYFKDVNSRFIRVSNAMKKLTKSGDAKELLGKSDFDIHLREAALEFKHEEEKIIKTKIGFANKLVYEIFPNGLVQWVSTTKMPLLDKNGNCTGTFGLTRDVTYLKKLEIEAHDQAKILKEREDVILKNEEEQRLLNQQKIKFFSVFSHDLKNPLNAMQGFTQLLWENYDKYDDAKRRKMLSDIVKLMGTFKAMITNLLDWSRSQLDTISVRPVNLILKVVIIEVTNLYRIQQSQKQISLEIDVDENLVITTDEQILQTVVRNLYSNALKYTHPGGLIKIKADITAECLKIDVIDNGVGMSQKEVKNLFTLRDEASKMGTLNEKGTGLGLIVCQEYLSHVNGHIEVDSDIDKGSVFSIFIPVNN